MLDEARTEQAHHSELVERAQCGDRAAFAALVACYQQAISGYLWRFTGDREVARDLTQDTFVRAYRAIENTAPGLEARPWLYRIATNLARDHYRRRHRFWWVPLAAVDEVLWTDETDAVEERDLVRQTLGQLRPDERAVLLLCGLERLPYAEAGAALGAGTEAVRKRFARAKERFREVYTRASERAGAPEVAA